MQYLLVRRIKKNCLVHCLLIISLRSAYGSNIPYGFQSEFDLLLVELMNSASGSSMYVDMEAIS